MSRWFPPPILAATVVVLSLAAIRNPSIAQTPPARRPSNPAVEKPAAEPATASEDMDDPWEERKLRAREDVQFLEAYLRSKQAECREAELRYTHAASWKADMDRQHQKGLNTTFAKNQSELMVAEASTQLEMRRAELKDIEIRLARSRRRLKGVERSGSASEPEGSQADDRFRELEMKYERLRDLIDRTKRADDGRKLEKLMR